MKKHILIAGIALVATLGLSVYSSVQATVPNVTQAIDVNTTGGAPNARAEANFPPALSQDGRYATWVSSASNLVSSPAANNKSQVFLRDLKDGTTTMISKSSTGDPGDLNSLTASVSATGRYVVYSSTAKNLTSDWNQGGYSHIYLYDTKTGTTQSVDKDNTGYFNYIGYMSWNPSVSADGKYVSFLYMPLGSSGGVLSSPSLTVNSKYLIMKNMVTGEVKLINKGLSNSAPNATQTDQNHAYMSCDGTYVAFTSTATNLVSGSNTSTTNAYLKNMRTGEIISLSPTADNGTTVNSISCNGQNVGIVSNSTNLTSTSVSSTYWQAYAYSRINNEFTLLSKSGSGTLGNNSSGLVSVSDNINYAAFRSEATNLTSGTITGKQIYLRNSLANTTELLSTSSSGAAANGLSIYPVISADAKYVSFISEASNIVSGHSAQDQFGNPLRLFYHTRTGVSYDF